MCPDLENALPSTRATYKNPSNAKSNASFNNINGHLTWNSLYIGTSIISTV